MDTIDHNPSKRLRVGAYDRESLLDALHELEDSYAMRSAEFYAAYARGVELAIPISHQNAWAAFFEEFRRMSATTSNEPVERASRAAVIQTVA